MMDPAPLSASQAAAFAAVAAREVGWVMPGVAREVAQWRERALAMPASPDRDDALHSLETKRFHTEGAALFATLPIRRNEQLLRLLVAQELLWDYLDTVSERPCADVVENGLQLHRAVSESLDPDAPISDYYRHHPWPDDGGYLRALVETCRELCGTLPSFARVHRQLVRQGMLARVCALNHDPCADRRDERLAEWVAREVPDDPRFAWYELTAAASSSLAIHALLALASEESCDERIVADTLDAYGPWVNLACIMLDSFADLVEDAASGDHSYLSHYPSLEVAVARLCEIVWRSADAVRRLPRGERHLVLATGMVAMYLSKDSACEAELRPAALRVMRAPGRMPAMIWPILRTWRRASSRSAC